MSASPPKDADVEPGDPTPENSEHMDRGDADSATRDTQYNELDVKEQDRWLPIANGKSSYPRFQFPVFPLSCLISLIQLAQKLRMFPLSSTHGRVRKGAQAHVSGCIHVVA
jgi:hypothetical protein